MSEPIRDLETAVRELGALPVPVGDQPQPLDDQRLAEIREHLASTRNWSIGNLAARDLLAEVERLRAERHSTNEALSDPAEALRADRDRIAELEKAAVEARAALGSLCYDLEDPGTAALGALHLLVQATTWTETGPDFAADALAQHDAKVLNETAQTLEAAGHDDDAVNLLYLLAARTTTPTAQEATR